MPKKIMIVDDDPDAILFLSTVLQDQGYETVEARNGQEGWELLKTEKPDLVLLDLMMPRKSGVSLLSDMKRHKDLKTIPVVMVTGVAGETGIDLESFLDKRLPQGDQSEALRPEGYLAKPVDPDELLFLLRKLLD